jgi:hypothetical protein
MTRQRWVRFFLVGAIAWGPEGCGSQPTHAPPTAAGNKLPGVGPIAGSGSAGGEGATGNSSPGASSPGAGENPGPPNGGSGSQGSSGGTAAAGSGDAATVAGDGAFDCSDLSNLNMAKFPTADQMWSALTNMVNMGPRHDGADGDHKWVAYLQQRMTDMGLQNITKDDVTVQGTNGLSGMGAPSSGTASHLYGLLPGASDDIIVLGVHSDGPNSIEENGSVVLTEVMQYLTEIPQKCRQHTFALVLASCHMATCTNGDVPGWAGLHSDVMSKAIAFLAPEHAGMMYRAGGSGTGPIAQAFLCKTPGGQGAGMVGAYCSSLLTSLNISPGMLAPSGTELGSSAAWDTLVNSQKPVIGSMAYWDSLTNGLTTTGIGTEQIDKSTFYKVTLFYGKMAGYMDGKTAAELKQ